MTPKELFDEIDNLSSDVEKTKLGDNDVLFILTRFEKEGQVGCGKGDVAQLLTLLLEAMSVLWDRYYDKDSKERAKTIMIEAIKQL